MDSKSDRLSAVARQRLLRSADSSSSPQSILDSPIVVKRHRLKRLTSSEVLKPEQGAAANNSAQTNGPDEISDQDPNQHENQFQSLVDAQAVNFSGSREVEQIDDGNLKIRLSRGQKCSVLGKCTIWVKDGTVLVYGARLQASTDIYKIYAPRTHALPQIEAVSRLAEFELSSLFEADFLSHGHTRGIWTDNDTETPAGFSFVMPGLTIEPAQMLSKQSRHLDIIRWGTIPSLHMPIGKSAEPSHSSKPTDESSPVFPRLLIHGRSGTGISTYLRCIINHHTTYNVNKQATTGAEGVLLLDLEPESPEFTPPGTIALLWVNRPILGPQFTHPTASTSDNRRILRMHFTGILEEGELMPSTDHCVEDLTDHIQEALVAYPGVPLVVHAPTILNKMSLLMAMKFWVVTRPTQVICCDSRPSTSWVPWKAVLENNKCLVRQIDTTTFHQMDSRKLHNLQMQSYFHSEALSSGETVWRTAPTLADDSMFLTLSFSGQSAPLAGVLLMDANIALEDTCDAITGGLVAIVAVEENFLTIPLETDSEDGTRSEPLPHTIALTEFERLPRIYTISRDPNPIRADKSQCLGLGIVLDVNADHGNISLATPVEATLKQQIANKKQFVLVAPRATKDGRFSTGWTQQEIVINSSVSKSGLKPAQDETTSNGYRTEEEG